MMRSTTPIESLALTARRSATDSSGASAVEYAILVAAIALAIVALVFQIGDSVTGLFEKAEGIYGN
jgi:Flp pilus assembly pilin Flp